MSFAGFPPGLIGFYRGLAADNSRARWDANKAFWQSDVREPLLAPSSRTPSPTGCTRPPCGSACAGSGAARNP